MDGQSSSGLAVDEEKYRSLISNFLDVVYSVELDGTITYVSPQVARYGYEPEELFSRNFYEFIAPDCREYVLRKFQESQEEGESFPTEFKWRGKDGRVFWVEALGKTIYDDAGQPLRQVGIVRNITERKRAEQALWENEEKFRALAESARAGIVLFRGDKFIYVNPETIIDLGYTKDELMAMNFWDVVHPDSRELVRSLGLKRLHGMPAPSTYEIKVLTKGGETLWEEVSAALIYYMGEPTVIATLFNITGRKRIEKDLMLTQFSIDRAADIALWVAPDGRFIYANEAASKAFGYTREEFLSLKAFDTNPYFNENNWGEHWKDVKERGSYTFEARLKRKDGTFFPGEITVNYLAYDGKEYNCSYIRDISERKRAEEALEESEGKFRVLAETTKAGISLYRGDKSIYANPGIEKITGYTSAELSSTAIWDYVHPDYRELVKKRAMDRERGLSVPDSYEFPIITRDGGTRWVEVSAGLITYQGEPTRMATYFDITERKRAEEELAEARAQAELYLDLMAHDINNMNQSAQGFLELALQTLDMDGKIGRDGKVLIEKPLQAVQSSSRLISNVRKLQRLADEGVKTRPVDLRDLYEELKSLEFHTGDRDSIINIHDAPHCLVEGSDLLRDVFFNLVSNAVKHAWPDRPVTVDVRAERVDQGGRAYYRCTVEDDGPGVPDELKPKLFHRFQRGKTQAHGKGLGLYLVRTLVEGYHGTAWAEDRVKGDHTKGARFVVMLPAIEK
jgi:PAS domain S-box-containing protein